MPIGAQVELAGPYVDILGFLESFVTWVLRESQGWSDAIDGIFPRRVVKVGEREALLVGTCVLLADQVQAPIYVRLLVAPGEIQRLECGVGQAGTIHQAETLVELACEDLRGIEWSHEARYVQ